MLESQNPRCNLCPVIGSRIFPLPDISPSTSTPMWGYPHIIKSILAMGECPGGTCQGGGQMSLSPSIHLISKGVTVTPIYARNHILTLNKTHGGDIIPLNQMKNIIIIMWHTSGNIGTDDWIISLCTLLLLNVSLLLRWQKSIPFTLILKFGLSVSDFH